MPRVRWLEKPEAHDFPAAADYLDLLADPHMVKELTERLRVGVVVHRKAKDILRAARLPLLSQDNPHVADDLSKIKEEAGAVADFAGPWRSQRRCTAADRRRLPPRLRELSHRREHRHSGDSRFRPQVKVAA
jgi:hypothetical protein